MTTPDLKRLGRYEVVGTLGKGAMGVVYEGLDPKLHRKVAIKTILTSALDPDTAKNYSMRFTREAQAVARLNHPNIVQVHDFGEEGDIAYIVMEFIKGKELKNFFDANERFEVKEAVRIMCELCDALHFAHEAGIIHRDIKPANVMIDSEGKVKLADFGVARITDADRTLTERTQAGTMIGTPAYMSPEQISGGDIDRRTDIFSAGIILYQFLTGERAFVGEGAWTIAKKIIQDHPPLPSSINNTISPLFDHVANKALAKKVKDRYQTAREFGIALKRALDGKTLEDEGNKLVAARVIEAPKITTAPQVAAAASSTQEVELEFWRAIKDGNDPDDFDLYVRQFPNGIYAELAKRKIAKLRGVAPEDIGAKAKEQEKNEAEEAAKREAEAKQKLADEKAKLEAQLAHKEAEYKKREADAEARRQAEAKARIGEIERVRKETDALLAKREAEETARRKADENARREAEARAKREAAERTKREADLAKREAELRDRLAGAPPRKSLVVPIIVAFVVAALGVGVFVMMKPGTSGDTKRMAELVAQLEEYKLREAELKQAKEKEARLDKEAELARQRETEMQKQAEMIRQREAEAKKAGDLAKQREFAELATQREAEAKKQAELTRQREAEARKQTELIRQREAEAKKQADAARQQQTELAKLESDQRKQGDAKKVAAERAAAEKVAQAKAAAEKSADAVRQAETQKQAEAQKHAEAQKQAEAERQAKAEADRKAVAQSAAAERAAAEQRASAEKAAQAKAEKAQVASVAPATSATAGGADALYKQAAALESEGKFAEAVRVYIQAARVGSGQAAKKLGDIYDKGAPGISIDPAESFKWYTLARTRGVDVGTAGRR